MSEMTDSKVEPSTGALVSACLDQAYCKYPACDCHTVASPKPAPDVIAALAVFLAFFENRPASVITVSAEAFERARDAVIEECAGVADAYSNEYRGAASDAGDDIANRIHKGLSEAQKRGLEFLVKAAWVSAWWGGKPHGGWPKELNARTHDKLISDGLIGWTENGTFRRKVMITPAGRAALASPVKGE